MPCNEVEGLEGGRIWGYGIHHSSCQLCRLFGLSNHRGFDSSLILFFMHKRLLQTTWDAAGQRWLGRIRDTCEEVLHPKALMWLPWFVVSKDAFQLVALWWLHGSPRTLELGQILPCWTPWPFKTGYSWPCWRHAALSQARDSQVFKMSVHWV